MQYLLIGLACLQTFQTVQCKPMGITASGKGLLPLAQNLTAANVTIPSNRNIIPISNSTNPLYLAPGDPWQYIDIRDHSRYEFHDYYEPTMTSSDLKFFLGTCYGRLQAQMAIARAEESTVYPRRHWLCEREPLLPIIPNFSFGWFNAEPSGIRPRTYGDVMDAIVVIDSWREEWTGRIASFVKGANIDLYVRDQNDEEVKTVAMAIQGFPSPQVT